jgi:hypothetical protein
MKVLSLFFVGVALVLTLGCGQAPTEAPVVVEKVVVEQSPAPETVVKTVHDSLYVCACGPGCDCGAVSTNAGACGCGVEMVHAKLLKVEGNVGVVCGCGAGCACALAEDGATCSCGQAVRRVSFEGKGQYYCTCGGECACNHVAAEPGTCACGMELVTS